MLIVIEYMQSFLDTLSEIHTVVKEELPIKCSLINKRCEKRPSAYRLNHEKGAFSYTI